VAVVVVVQMGLEFRESALSITNKNLKVIKEGMVFNISPGFHNLERKGEVQDPRKKVYSMMVGDTVVVSAPGSDPKTLTANVPSAWDEISYSVGGGDEEEEAEEKPAPKSSGKGKGKEREAKKEAAPRTSSRARDAGGDSEFGIRTTRARDAGKKSQQDMAAELRRKKHQEELEKKKREEAAARFSKSKDGADTKDAGGAMKDVAAYKSASEFPPEARNGRIFVDQKREAVLLPIYGMLVPFHISTIKNATKSEDYLRINFVTPGSTLPNDKLPRVFKDGKATFVREMSFRCSDTKSLATSLRLVNELRKRASSRAHDTHVRDSLVAQEELVLSKGTNIPIRLPFN
jgi:nucleosome binding factor SPN SPT16 subunit